MITALRVYLIAALAECVVFGFMSPEVVIIVFPIALIGGFPGMLVYGLMLKMVRHNIRDKAVKWTAVVVATLVASNATLLLTLKIMGGFSWSEFGYFSVIVSGVALFGMICSVKSIHKTCFNHHTISQL